jgi:hypothetical protein
MRCDHYHKGGIPVTQFGKPCLKHGCSMQHEVTLHEKAVLGAGQAIQCSIGSDKLVLFSGLCIDNWG